MVETFFVGVGCGLVSSLVSVVVVCWQIKWWQWRANYNGQLAADQCERANYWQARAEGGIDVDDEPDSELDDTDYRGG